MEQRTEEWYAARLGRVTASRVADVIARAKSGWGASRANYMAELICERLTGVQYEKFTSREMDRGTEVEESARSAYEFMHDVDIEQVGFVPHPTIAMSGASPDGLVGVVGLVEFKSPNTATHMDTLLGKPISGRYFSQMQWQMACTGREWCDFVSFDPRMPANMAMSVQRVYRDASHITVIEGCVTDFLVELDRKLQILKERFSTGEDGYGGRYLSPIAPVDLSLGPTDPISPAWVDLPIGMMP